jgi:hypothetical protein
MTAIDFITILFCRVDAEVGRFPQHSQGKLHPSEIVVNLHAIMVLPHFMRLEALGECG